jgi:hypothetical protein
MRGSIRYAISVLATGVMVLIFFAIPVFFGRLICDLRLMAAMPAEGSHVSISPTSLVPPELELKNQPNEPNDSFRPSGAYASLSDEVAVEACGIFDYIVSHGPGGRRCGVFRRDDDDLLYFDRSTGQIFFNEVQSTTVDGYPRAVRKFYRAGPEGITEAASETIGRFISPTVKHIRGPRPMTIVYEPSLRQFFALDWRAQTVRSSPQLDRSYRFAGSGSRSIVDSINVSWRPSMQMVKRVGETNPNRQYDWKFPMRFTTGDRGRYIPVISGDSMRIDLLDLQTMEILRDKGVLPAPKTLFGQGEPRPSQLLDYDVCPVYAWDTEGPADYSYRGLVVGTASRQGTSLALGEIRASDSTPLHVKHSSIRPYRVVMDDVRSDRSIDSAKAVISQTPWGRLLAVGKFVCESLHPPVLTLASFFVVDRIDARAGYRTFFLMPNSFAAMQRDRVGESIAAQFGWVVWFMVPALLLSAFLTWRVGRDACAVGLSSNARLLWAVGTLSFGLPAYITYRLTRPAEGLVTCPNCGHARRSDTERCHRCGSPWLVPELTPPTWRVIGEPEEQPCDSTPAPKEETNPATESQG